MNMARLTRLILLTLVVASLTLLAACGSRESRRDAHFERAKKYLAEGKSAEAIIELKNTAQIDPKYAPAYGLLGETYLKTNDYRSALSLYNKAVQLAPTDLAYVVPLANILVAARQFDRLDEVLNALPEEARKGYSIITVEAASLQLRDRGDEATSLLTALLGRQDLKVEEQAAVNLALAQMAIQGKRLEEAQGYAQAALTAQPEAVTALLLLARIQEERGDLKAAEATLSGAPAKIADNVRLTAGLIGYYGRQNRIDDVQRVIDAFAASPDLSAEGRLLAADTYLRLRNVARAEAMLVAGMEQEKPDARLIVAFTRIKAAEGKIDEAVTVLEAAAQRVKAPSAVHTSLARLDIQLQHLDKAKEVVGQILAANAEDFDGRVLQAQVELLSKDAQGALDHFRELLKAAPQDPQVHAGLAGCHLALGEELLGRQELEKVVELSPENTTARIQLARLYLKDKDADTALARLEPLGEMNAPPPEGIELLLSLLFQKGKVEEAHKVIDTLTERFPNNSIFATQRAVLEARTGNLDKGIALLKKQVEANPKSVDLLSSLSRLYEWGDKGTEAVATYNRILELQPDEPMAANNLAFRLAETGQQMERAAELAKALMERFPKDANVADTYAWVLHKQGKAKEARELLEKVLGGAEASKVPPIVRYHQAAIALAAGEHDAALTAIDQCLAAKPQGPWVKEAEALQKKLKG